MKMGLVAAGAILLSVGTPTSAHRLDEYLQATTISVEKDRVQAQIRLTPGVAVFPIVLAQIDTDADGVISEAEQPAYAERVLRDLSLTIDGNRLRLRLVSSRFATAEEMKEGRGDIRLKFNADLPRSGPNRRLSKPDCGLSCKLPGPVRPGYSGHSAEPKLPAVALSIGLRAGRSSLRPTHREGLEIAATTDPNFPEEMHERHTLYRREQTADWNYHPSLPQALPLGPVTAVSSPSPSYYATTNAEQINAQRKAYGQSLLEQNRAMKERIDALQRNESAIQSLQSEVERLRKELDSRKESRGG